MLESQQRALEIRRRLRNPPNGRVSGEIEIMPSAAFRRVTVDRVVEKADEMPIISDEQRRELYTQAFSECLAIMREALGDAGLLIARELVSKADPEGPPIGRPPGVIDVIRAVSRFYNISVTEIVSARRSAPLVKARRVAMYICRHHTLKSYPEISRRLGDRDHTTVMAGVEKIERMLETDEDLEADIGQIVKSLGLRV